MILKEERYPEGNYRNRDDILFVHAKSLKRVSEEMFQNCTNLQLFDSPCVEAVETSGFKGCHSLKSFDF